MGKYGPTSSKLMATTFSGGLVLLVTWAVGEWGGVDVPAEVALGTATVIQTIVGWFTPETRLIQR